MMAKVSIVIPAFNALRWLPETLASAVSQSVSGLEIIVVDDGSTDGTGDIVTRTHPQVRLIRTDNRGCSAARSLGAEQARGEYIKYLDADDLLLPGMVERQVKLARETGADVVYGNWQKLESSAGVWAPASKVSHRFEDVDPDIQIAFLLGMWCPTGAYLWRSSFLRERHPGWHAGLPVIQDARYPLDGARAGARFAHDDQVGILYRVHESGSVSTRSREAFLKDCWLSIQETAEAWRAEGCDLRRNKAIRTAATGVLRAAYREAPGLFSEIWANWKAIAGTNQPEGHALFRLLCHMISYPRAEKLIIAAKSLRSSSRTSMPCSAHA